MCSTQRRERVEALCGVKSRRGLGESVGRYCVTEKRRHCSNERTWAAAVLNRRLEEVAVTMNCNRNEGAQAVKGRCCVGWHKEQKVGMFVRLTVPLESHCCC